MFLLFVPLIWVLWLWVSFSPVTASMFVLTPSTDDRIKTNHRIPHLPNLLQLPRHGVFRKSSCLSGQMGRRSMYVFLPVDKRRVATHAFPKPVYPASHSSYQ